MIPWVVASRAGGASARRDAVFLGHASPGPAHAIRAAFEAGLGGRTLDRAVGVLGAARALLRSDGAPRRAGQDARETQSERLAPEPARPDAPLVRSSPLPPALLGLALLGPLAGCQGSTSASVGAVFGRDKNTHALVVRGVAEGQAAHRAGVEPGDEMLFVDGTYVRDLEKEELQRLLRGEAGTAVDVTVVKPNGDVRYFRLVRTELGQANVKMIETPK